MLIELKKLLHGLHVFAPEEVFTILHRASNVCVPNNAQSNYNLTIPRILAIEYTIAMAFFYCILTSYLNLKLTA